MRVVNSCDEMSMMFTFGALSQGDVFDAPSSQYTYMKMTSTDAVILQSGHKIAFSSGSFVIPLHNAKLVKGI